MMYSISRSRNPNMLQSRERNSKRYLSTIVLNVFHSSVPLMALKLPPTRFMFVSECQLLPQHTIKYKKYSIAESKRDIQQTEN